MDKAERLTQFLDWVEARRASSLAGADLRGIASQLLDESAGGRVTESHILTVGDRVSQQGGGEQALHLVTECGELFLRFEEWQRQAGMPSAAPPPRKHLTPEPGAFSAASTTPLPAPTPAPAPADVAPPLRPPERVPTVGEPVIPPSPVTFTSRSTHSSLPLPSPKESQPVAATALTLSDVRESQKITGPVLASQPVPSSQRLPGPRESQRLAGAFRCPKCAVMVIPGEDGNCPRCGGAPPHTVSIPTASTPPPAAMRSDAKGINWLVPLALLGAGVLGSILGVRWSKTACDQNRGQSVAGEARVDKLGVKLYFPGGWRRHKGTDDIAPIPGGATGKMLGYYRGGTSDDPEVGLMLMVTDDLPLPPGTPEISDADFQKLLDATSSNMSHNDVQFAPCEITQIGLHRTGRCTGKGRERGESRQVVLYTWTMDKRLGIAFFFARGKLDQLLSESDEIVGSIEKL